MSSNKSLKPKKRTPNHPRTLISPSSSSLTSSSKQFPETSHDGESSPTSSSSRTKLRSPHTENTIMDAERERENVTVIVRFRPLSPREIRQGEEIAWYADGETIVRNEHNPSLAYAYDRVFGPTTTTRQVYDVAAQHVVSDAMEGINGTIFAYGVTSSGKTHTMHGDKRSPGIIPLAVKDAFSIIQETPSREFLLRVSYIEIYNEVVNDLLNPLGQNLRIREDSQGTFVEGIKEDVVLSPAHALSLIAAGEEHRHVGSTQFNILSSRSHTIFTLAIESSPCLENCHEKAVNFSQLNLIDLAGSESSRAKTTGIRQREGSYINKSLLTLGTVISKLTDGKATHISYRDSKLTRLLQSSLCGHGRVSLQDDEFRLQSTSEGEEEAKASLLGRIERLTNLILVSTKVSHSPDGHVPRRRHSFGEEELAYLPHRRRDISLDDENDDPLSVCGESHLNSGDCTVNDDRKSRRHGILNWLKPWKRDGGELPSVAFPSDGLPMSSSTPQIEVTAGAFLQNNGRDALYQLSSSELISQLSEKSFELEVRSADNRVLQEKLQEKIDECEVLKQQLVEWVSGEEVDDLKKRLVDAACSRELLELQNLKLVEESSHARSLAAAAAVELRALSEEVSKLMSHNESLASEVTTLKNATAVTHPGGRATIRWSGSPPELALSRERETSYEAAFVEKYEREAELQRRVEECELRESHLQNELTNLWVLVARLDPQLAYPGVVSTDSTPDAIGPSHHMY